MESSAIGRVSHHFSESNHQPWASDPCTALGGGLAACIGCLDAGPDRPCWAWADERHVAPHTGCPGGREPREDGPFALGLGWEGSRQAYRTGLAPGLPNSARARPTEQGSRQAYRTARPASPRPACPRAREDASTTTGAGNWQGAGPVGRPRPGLGRPSPVSRPPPTHTRQQEPSVSLRRHVRGHSRPGMCSVPQRTAVGHAADRLEAGRGGAVEWRVGRCQELVGRCGRPAAREAPTLRRAGKMHGPRGRTTGAAGLVALPPASLLLAPRRFLIHHKSESYFTSLNALSGAQARAPGGRCSLDHSRTRIRKPTRAVECTTRRPASQCFAGLGASQSRSP